MTARRLGVTAAYADGSWIDGDVVVDDGVVREFGALPAGGRGRAVPGFVDVQVNGFAGVSFSDCDRDGYATATAAMARHGVTAFLPTIPTAAPDSYSAALVAAADAIDSPPAGARPLGVHLEGPFLSPLRPGAHNPEWLCEPDTELAAALCGIAPVAVMTLAPELDGAVALIELLVALGVVVSAGHSDATAAQAHAAFDAGVTMVTHVWNAQRQITSREAGLAGAGLTRPGVHVGLIADLVHLSAETLALSLATAGDRAVVVTDAAAEAGLPDGRYEAGGRTVVVGDGAVRLPNGTLAGASIGLDECLRNVVAVGVPLERALATVTTAPASLLGRTDIGHLAAGGRADLVVLDDDLTVSRVLVGGNEI